MTNRQNERTSRQDDIENRHQQVIFDPDYRYEAPGLPLLLCKQAQERKPCFHIGITAVSKMSNFQHLFWEVNYSSMNYLYIKA